MKKKDNFVDKETAYFVKKESHNVYSFNHQYRIRIYRDDKKFFEKQIHLPYLSFFSFSEEIVTILKEFAYRTLKDIGKKDKFEFYDEKMLNILNRANLLGQMLEEINKRKYCEGQK